MFIADMFKGYMVNRNYTLKNMSEKTGLSISYLCELVNGVKVPTSKRVKTVCLYLFDVEEEELGLLCELSQIARKRKVLEKKEIKLLKELQSLKRKER